MGSGGRATQAQNAKKGDHLRLRAVEPVGPTAMADSTMENPGAGSNAADEALIEALREADFQGDGWDLFAKELARYGLPIISSWISSLRNFAKCAEESAGCPGPPHNIRKLSDDKASEMANEISARALNQFRDKVLRPGQWPPPGGASLNVMFITQCILQFPNVYRHWQVETRRLLSQRLLTDDRYDGLEELEFTVAGPDGEPRGLVVIREEIAHALEHYVKDPRAADAPLISRRYSPGENDEMLGVTKNALDGVLQRHWRTLRRRPDGLDGAAGEGVTAP